MGAKLNPTEQRRRILLVDPDHETFMRLILLLDEGAHNRYTMDWAATFRFGTSLPQRNDYDLAMVGSSLGFHSGLEFTHATHQISPDLPLIVLQHSDGLMADIEPTEAVWDFIELDRLESSALMSSISEACAHRSNA